MKTLYMYGIAILGFFSACTDRDQIEMELAQQELILKIDLYQLQKAEECRQLAFQRAEYYVDSLLLHIDLQPLKSYLMNRY